MNVFIEWLNNLSVSFSFILNLYILNKKKPLGVPRAAKKLARESSLKLVLSVAINSQLLEH